MHGGAINGNAMLRERLEALADDCPELAQTARLFASILPILRDEDVHVPSIGLSTGEVREQLEEQGIPLLEGIDLEFDVQQVTGLLARLAAAAEKAGARVSAEKIRLWLDEEHFGDVSAAFRSILAGDSGLLGSTAERKGMDGELCALLAYTAMKPVLRSWNRQLAVLASGAKWDKGICFVCGSAPIFAELQGNDQEKHLRCGLCGADWRVARLSCPHCGNEDHRTLRVFLQENDPCRPRIEACDRCMNYLKVIPAFSPTPVDLLPVEDLATLRLDAVACEEGYRRAAEDQ